MFAVRNQSKYKCKHCSLVHEFITFRHLIIVAINDYEKAILKRQERLRGEIVEVELKDLKLGFITVEEYLERKKKNK